MDFEFEHRFHAPVDTVAETLLDEDYQESLDGIGPLETRRLLEQRTTGQNVVRRVRCVLGVDLGAAKRFLGGGEPAWVEEATWNPGRSRWDWVIHPEVAAHLLTASGAIELRDQAGSTIRAVSGSVKVHVPLYGGKVEGVIVRGLKDAYAEEAKRLASWLEQT